MALAQSKKQIQHFASAAEQALGFVWDELKTTQKKNNNNT